MEKPDLEYCAKYPFTEEARKYVEGLSLTIEELLKHPVYGSCLKDGKRRFLDALEGRINSKSEDKISQELSVLSYPVARMISFMVGEPSKTRYAVSEAKAAYELFKDDEDERKRLMRDMKLEFEDGAIDLLEYLRLAERIAKTDCRWLLVNMRVDGGRVTVEEPERKELLTEKIMLKVASPVDVNKIPPEVTRIAKELKNALSSVSEVKLDGDLSAESTPPCIGNILALLEAGQATHNMMFILGTYLTGLGLSEDKIVEVFSKSPAFNENKTRYQLKFLTGEKGSTKYSCPTCSKIKSYGLCRRDCGVKHPLQYGKKLT